jgi:hypothetical protein
MKTMAKVLTLMMLGLAALGAGVWTCLVVNRYAGQGTDWKFLGAVLVPTACLCTALWCAGSGWRLAYESRRKKAFMRAAVAAGYPPKEIRDCFK